MSEEKQSSAGRRRRWARLSVIVLFVALSGLSGFLFYKYKEAVNAPNEAEQLASRLGTLIQLPNEKSSLLTISDKTKLSNQVLAASVKNGDQLLVYEKAKQIIVYRPSNQKVVNMLSIQNSTPVVDGTIQTAPTNND